MGMGYSTVGGTEVSVSTCVVTVGVGCQVCGTIGQALQPSMLLLLAKDLFLH